MRGGEERRGEVFNIVGQRAARGYHYRHPNYHRYHQSSKIISSKNQANYEHRYCPLLPYCSSPYQTDWLLDCLSTGITGWLSSLSEILVSAGQTSQTQKIFCHLNYKQRVRHSNGLMVDPNSNQYKFALLGVCFDPVGQKTARVKFHELFFWLVELRKMYCVICIVQSIPINQKQ